MEIKNKVTVEQFTYASSILIGFIVFVIGIVEVLATVFNQIQAGSILRDQMTLQVASLIIGMALVNLSIAVRALIENRKLDMVEENVGNGDIDGEE